MADAPGWSDNATLAGVAGVATALGAVLKTLLDWRTDRGKDRQSSEDLARDDQHRLIDTLIQENREIRQELAAARAELAESARRLSDCELRGVKFQQELANIRAELRALRARQGDV